MVDTAELGRLIVTVEGEGAEETNESIEKLEGNIKDTQKTTRTQTPKIERLMKRWGIVFAGAGIAAAALFGDVLLRSPLVQGMLSNTLDIIGSIITLLALSIGVDKFFTKLNTGLADLATIIMEEGFLGALEKTLPPFVAFLTGGEYALANVRLQEMKTNLEEMDEETKESPGFWKTLKDNIVTKAQELRDGVVGWIKNLFDKMSEQWRNIKKEARKHWNRIRDVIVGQVKNLFNKLGEQWGAIKTSASEWWNRIKNAIVPAAISIKNSVVAAFNKIIDTIRTAIRTLREFISLEGGTTGGGGGGARGGGQIGPASGRGVITPSFAGGGDVTIQNTIVLDGRVIGESMSRKSAFDIRRQGGRAI